MRLFELTWIVGRPQHFGEYSTSLLDCLESHTSGCISPTNLRAEPLRSALLASILAFMENVGATGRGGPSLRIVDVLTSGVHSTLAAVPHRPWSTPELRFNRVIKFIGFGFTAWVERNERQTIASIRAISTNTRIKSFGRPHRSNSFRIFAVSSGSKP